MIRLLAVVALAAATPLAAQNRPRDAAPPVSRTDRDHYGPLARYDLLTERVDRKDAKAHEYQRDTPAIREWKRRQSEQPMDDDDDS